MQPPKRSTARRRRLPRLHWPVRRRLKSVRRPRPVAPKFDVAGPYRSSRRTTPATSQSAMNQVGGSGTDGADRLPQQHQQEQDVAGLGTGIDPQFVMLRQRMRDRIHEYIGRKQSSADWRRWLPELAKRLEEILFRKFPNKNEYYNMMMNGPIEPQLAFSIKTLAAQHKQQTTRQTPSSSNYGPMIPTPAITQDADPGDLQSVPQMNQVGIGGADRPPQQPQQGPDVAGLGTGTDPQFVMLRHSMRDRILEFIGRKQSSAEWRPRLPDLAKRFEEILFTKFSDKNGYYNMMQGSIEPQLLFAIKTLSARNQENQQNQQTAGPTASSSKCIM